MLGLSGLKLVGPPETPEKAQQTVFLLLVHCNTQSFMFGKLLQAACKLSWGRPQKFSVPCELRCGPLGLVGATDLTHALLPDFAGSCPKPTTSIWAEARLGTCINATSFETAIRLRCLAGARDLTGLSTI